MNPSTIHLTHAIATDRACVEQVLETYEKPYDAACPVLCMDEQPVQLLKEAIWRDHPIPDFAIRHAIF